MYTEGLIYCWPYMDDKTWDVGQSDNVFHLCLHEESKLFFDYGPPQLFKRWIIIINVNEFI